MKLLQQNYDQVSSLQQYTTRQKWTAKVPNRKPLTHFPFIGIFCFSRNNWLLLSTLTFFKQLTNLTSLSPVRPPPPSQPQPTNLLLPIVSDIWINFPLSWNTVTIVTTFLLLTKFYICTVIEPHTILIRPTWPNPLPKHITGTFIKLFHINVLYYFSISKCHTPKIKNKNRCKTIKKFTLHYKIYVIQKC